MPRFPVDEIINFLSRRIGKRSHARLWPEGTDAAINDIDTIYYDSGESASLGGYATTLKGHLEDVSATIYATTDTPAANWTTIPYFSLSVNAALPAFASMGDEAFYAYRDSYGYHIVGKTALACRHGMYTMLDDLGYRWYFKHDAWSITPASLVDISLNRTMEAAAFRRLISIPATPGAQSTTDWNNWSTRNRVAAAVYYPIQHSYGEILGQACAPPQMTEPNLTQRAEIWAAHPEYFNPNYRRMGPYTADAGTSPTQIVDAEISGKAISPHATDSGDYSHIWNITRGARAYIKTWDDGTDTITMNAIAGQAPGDQYYLFLNLRYQLDPLNADVEQFAKDYADGYFAAHPTYGSVSIHPRDESWGAPYTDHQDCSDAVFHLVNEVAKYLQVAHPGKYAGCAAYSTYANVPDLTLESNVMVIITTMYNYGDDSLAEQMAGFPATGCTCGLYEYPDYFPAKRGLPNSYVTWGMLPRINQMGSYGMRIYTAEGEDEWGSKGMTYWLMMKLLWESSLSISDLVEDFCLKSFGAAYEPMKRYFDRYDSGPSGTAYVRAAFNDLAEAESLAGGDADILARIRHLEYYQRFLWYFNIYGGGSTSDATRMTNLTDTQLQDFWDFSGAMRYIYSGSYYNYLMGGFGASFDVIEDELITRGLPHVEDNTPPDAATSLLWLHQALAYFFEAPTATLDENDTVAIDCAIEWGTWTYAINTAPSHGNLVGVLPNVTYEPTPYYNGSDSFIYDVKYLGATLRSVTVDITVNPVVSPFVANNGNANTPTGVPVNITLTATDPDSRNHRLLFEVTSGPSHGVLDVYSILQPYDSVSIPDINTVLGLHWALERYSGVSVTDDSAYGNDGTFNKDVGPSIVDGKFVNGLYLPSWGDHIQCPDAASISPTNSITVAMWMKASASQNYCSLFKKGPLADYAYDWQLYMSANDFNFQLYDNLGGVFSSGSYTYTAFPDGTWHHYMCIYDGADVQLYIDNVLKKSSAAAGKTIRDIGTNFMVCRRHGNYLHGDIDEVQVWTRNLNAAERLAVYTNDLYMNPTVVYTPNPGYTGADSFTFTVTDGVIGSNTATISINVT